MDPSKYFYGCKWSITPATHLFSGLITPFNLRYGPKLVLLLSLEIPSAGAHDFSHLGVQPFCKPSRYHHGNLRVPPPMPHAPKKYIAGLMFRDYEAHHHPRS